MKRINTTWNRRRRFPRSKRQRIMAEIAQVVDVAFKINEDRARSWREEIVEEEVLKDKAS